MRLRRVGNALGLENSCTCSQLVGSQVHDVAKVEQDSDIDGQSRQIRQVVFSADHRLVMEEEGDVALRVASRQIGGDGRQVQEAHQRIHHQQGCTVQIVGLVIVCTELVDDLLLLCYVRHSHAPVSSIMFDTSSY